MLQVVMPPVLAAAPHPHTGEYRVLSVTTQTPTVSKVVSATEQPPNILGATTSSCSLTEESHGLFVRGLSRKCESTPSLQIIVNLFDAPVGERDSDLGVQTKLVTGSGISKLCNNNITNVPSFPRCVRGVSRVRGYKHLFLKHVLTPETTAPFDFVWYFDNDMDAGDPPTPFQLLDAVRTMRDARIALAQPIVRCLSTSRRRTCELYRLPDGTITQPGHRKAHSLSSSAVPAGVLSMRFREPIAAQRLAGEDFPFLTRDLEQGCRAQLVGFVEQQTPIFSRDGWRIFQSRMLAILPDEMYHRTDRGLDAYWCSMMERELPTHAACAVLATPIMDFDFQTIATARYRSSNSVADTEAASWIRRVYPTYVRANISMRFNVSAGRGPCLAW